MNVHEVKDELEKVAKFIPDLRRDLDEAYKLDHGKKSRIKLLWKEYQDEYKKIQESAIYKNLQ